MTKNPILNALAAAGYIVFIVLIIMFAPKVLAEEKETILIPMFMLSLLVLSASVMSYIFFYKPVQLFLEGQKKEAQQLFLRTIGFFAGVVIIFFILLLLFN